MRKILRADAAGALALALLLWVVAPDAPVADSAMRGDLEGVRTLIKQGADVNASQGDGMTALHWAALNGSTEIAELVIASGANLEAVTRLGGYTPLHLAARAGRVNTTRVLLDAGASVKAGTSTGGVTPLHFAALDGSVPRIETLLAAGADPALRTTKASHWRSSIMSRSFGPGIPIPAGATAYDLARQRQKETRWVTHAHDAAVERLKAVTPRTGWRPFQG